MDYKPFRLFGDAELKTVEHYLRERFQSWLVKWCGESSACTVDVIDLGVGGNPTTMQVDVGDDQLFTQYEAEQLKLYASEDEQCKLLSQSLKLPVGILQHEHELILEKLLADLFAVPVLRLVDRGALSVTERMQHERMQKGSGRLFVRITSDMFCCEIEAEHGLFSEQLPIANTPVSLETRQASIIDEAVHIRAELGRVKLSLSQVVGLQPGDVITTDIPFGASVTVQTDQGLEVTQAELGSHKGCRALRIGRDNQ